MFRQIGVLVFCTTMLLAATANTANTPTLGATSKRADAAFKKCSAGYESSGRGSDWFFAQCEKEVQEVWDKALNTVYAGLLKTLPEPCNTLLRKSQRAWVAYRDADNSAFEASVGVRPGSEMFASAARSTRIVAERVTQLIELSEKVNADPSTRCPKL